MILRIAIIAATLAVCCGCYDTFERPAERHETIIPTVTVAELHSRYYGKPFVIDADMSVAGYVASSDRAGNFYRTFVVCDGSGGAEIMAGIHDLHSIWPVGCVVSVNLCGCAVGEYMGVLRIGLPAEAYDYYDVDYFYSKVNLDRHIVRSGEVKDAEIKVLRADELERSLCGCLVRIESLRLLPDYAGSSWDGYRVFEDSAGCRIGTVTDSYADFAGDTLPDGAVDITGILQYGKVSGEEMYILKMRDIEDCIANN